MRIITKVEAIIKDTESFASSAEKELTKLWGGLPNVDDVALTTLTYVGPILETVFTEETGEAGGAIVTAVITKAEQDLTAAKGLIAKIGPTSSVANLINGIGSDLSSLLAAANITNPTSVANVTIVVKELAAIVASFATPAPAAPAPTPAAPEAKTPAATSPAVVSLN